MCKYEFKMNTYVRRRWLAGWLPVKERTPAREGSVQRDSAAECEDR